MGDPVGDLLAAGVGAIGLGVFATFGLWGYFGSPGYRSLQACAPGCSPADVDTVRGRFLVSDVGLAVGVVGAGVATVLWLTRGHGEKPPPPAQAFTPGPLTLRF